MQRRKHIRSPVLDQYRRRVALAATLLVISLSGVARADPEPVPLDTSHCEPTTAARLQWLVDRLESRERHADWWWRGWIGFYGLGVVVEGIRAGLEDDSGKRADQIVSAVKAVGGVTRLYYFRPVARLGAAPLLADTPDEGACRQRVAQGEELLRQAAKESERRWDWKAHLANVGVNVAGALIVTQAFDEDDGWTSAGVGIAVGEVMLWSHPWTGRRDLEEYEERFASNTGTRVSWSVLPYERGLRVQMRF